MNIKNNYNECITNVACSIRKYFELEYHHQTNSYIDKILEKYNPTNVVLILFDGMGSRILDKTLSKEDFFIKNKVKEITTVFPATTTAATTSIRTGLNPVEHNWLGWNTYIKPINKTITLFRNHEKGKDEICEEFLNVKDKLVTTTIADEINNNGKYKAMELFPFGDNPYQNLDDMLNIIKEETKKTGHKYIYAYDPEPDHTMHDFGPFSNETKTLIEERNKKVEELSNSLEDTLLIVIADHGHIKVDNIYLENYPEIINTLERTPSLEQRAISFKIKEAKKEEFEQLFNKNLGEWFNLYPKEEVITSQLFGDGIPNELFESAIGDYIAIAENSNKCLVGEGDESLYSQHAGYTDDEVYIPLIISNKTKKLKKSKS